MGLVFLGRQMQGRNHLVINNLPIARETVISNRALKPITCVNSKQVKDLTSENRLFLKKIGIFNKEK